MEFTSNGHHRKFDHLSRYKKRKIMYDNMHLTEGIEFTSDNQFAQLQPYNGSTNFDVIAYSDRKKHTGKNQALHFFENDYVFREAVWNRLEQTTHSISKYDFVFTPDFSLWVDLNTNFFNKESIFKTRFIGAYWQHCGFNVIPTVSWGNIDSFKYCLEGLPTNSILAISGMGHRKSVAAKKLWEYALRKIEEQKKPTMLLIYGEHEDIPFVRVPIKFIECFISRKFRNE